jgi:hypothetical protein
VSADPAAAPSGVVAFLFTDVEGSTRRWEADAEGMRVALAAHDDVLCKAIEAHGGWLFKHTGDGVCAAFASPRSAVDAAVAAQRALELPVRMGIATGEAELRGDDYFGAVLNRAARVMAAAHGGRPDVDAGLHRGGDAQQVDAVSKGHFGVGAGVKKNTLETRLSYLGFHAIGLARQLFAVKPEAPGDSSCFPPVIVTLRRHWRRVFRQTPRAARTEPTASREVQSSAVRAYPPPALALPQHHCTGVDQVVTDRRRRRKR